MGHFCICIVGIAMQPPFQMVVLEVLNYVLDVLHFGIVLVAISIFVQGW